MLPQSMLIGVGQEVVPERRTVGARVRHADLSPHRLRGFLQGLII